MHKSDILCANPVDREPEHKTTNGIRVPPCCDGICQSAAAPPERPIASELHRVVVGSANQRPLRRVNGHAAAGPCSLTACVRPATQTATKKPPR
ncbi:unnamed protein product [Boreogadus saida]